MMRVLTARAAILALLAASPLQGPALGDSSLGTSVRTPVRAPPLDPQSADAFGKLVAKLSEPGGFFDSDNLISNEASYLHVLGPMRRLGVSGGAYLGVGPDQNFSYIAQVRPKIAYMIDIRRDNLLQHLLFKALFEMSRNRVEYLALLFGKPVPANVNEWNERTIEKIVAYIDSVPAQQDVFEPVRKSVTERVRSYGIPLDSNDLETIARNHREFFANGLELRFSSYNRPPRPYYPTYRQLILERDLTGRQGSFLAREDDFQYVKSLEGAGLVVPVVGDLSGDHAVRAIARDIAERGEKVSAFYTSNVEFYLMRGASFERFARNVKQLPIDSKSVMIRSFFSGGFGGSHPSNVTGYFSTQLLQTISSFVKEFDAGGYPTYWDVVTKHLVEPRP
jgi:hypothetical protein